MEYWRKVPTQVRIDTEVLCINYLPVDGVVVPKAVAAVVAVFPLPKLKLIV